MSVWFDRLCRQRLTSLVATQGNLLYVGKPRKADLTSKRFLRRLAKKRGRHFLEYLSKVQNALRQAGQILHSPKFSELALQARDSEC